MDTVIATLGDLVQEGEARIRTAVAREQAKEKAEFDQKQAKYGEMAEAYLTWLKRVLPAAVHDYIDLDNLNKEGYLTYSDPKDFCLRVPGFAPISFYYNGKGLEDGIAILRYQVATNYYKYRDEVTGYPVFRFTNNFDYGQETIEVALAIAARRGKAMQEEWNAALDEHQKQLEREAEIEATAEKARRELAASEGKPPANPVNDPWVDEEVIRGPELQVLRSLRQVITDVMYQG